MNFCTKGKFILRRKEEFEKEKENLILWISGGKGIFFNAENW